MAIGCGELDPGRRPDVDLLFVGSHTNLLVYDCVKNADVFDREINDGLSTIAMCEPGCCQAEVVEPLVIVGGNQSIAGLDVEGEERFWTVSSGNVVALEFLDYDNDGLDEMMVGCDDMTLRVLKSEDALLELAEKAPFHSLVKITENTYGYSLTNGSFGVYKNEKKMWRSPKSKDFVTSICGANIDLYEDGQQLLIIGF